MAYHGFRPAEQAIQIGDDEILSSHISDGVIVNADVNASAAIATSKVSGAVTSIGSHGLGSLATLSAVASAQITDGTIVNADVNNSAAIATSKLSGSLTSVGSHGLATSATTDTTSASNISSGTLAHARLPAAATTITSLGTLTALTGGTGDLIWDTPTFVVDSSANGVGIGTTSMATVSGATDLTVGNTTGAHGITILSQSNTVGNIFFAEAVGTVTGKIEYSNDIQDMFFTAGSSRRMTINSTGVGIGTESPSSMLHLNGADPIVRLQDSVGGDVFGLYVSDSSGFGIYNFTDSRQDLTIDGSGNVGIGITAPDSAALHIQKTGTTASPHIRLTEVSDTREGSIYNDGGGSLIFENHGTDNVEDAAIRLIDSQNVTIRTANAERIRINSTGDVGIGTTTPNIISGWTKSSSSIAILNVKSASAGARIAAQGADASLDLVDTGATSGSRWWSIYNNADKVYMRTLADDGSAVNRDMITFNLTTGNVGFNDNDPGNAISVYANVASWAQFTRNAHSTAPHGIPIYYTNDPDNHSGKAYYLYSGTTERFMVENDGDVKNHDNSYGSISDERIKTDIRDANSQWDDIKALRVRNFKRKDDVVKYGEDAKDMIGLVAQEAELVSPHLVKESTPAPFEIEHCGIPESGTTKTMMYSVLYMKAIKALQEAMTRIEALENA